MNKKLKIGIAGAGFIAGLHLECMLRTYGVNFEVVGVTDIVQQKAKAFADEHVIKAYSSYEEMLDSVDVVDICTPPFAHEENILAAAEKQKHIICEKPLIGYAPKDKEDGFKGNEASKKEMYSSVFKSLKSIDNAVKRSSRQFAYFENFVYTPQVQKEAEILRKTDAQVLRMMGEEAHKGNHAEYSSHWKYACGGSLISTGSHPIGGILYLKRVEGLVKNGRPIRPAAVSARTHELTKIENYKNEGYIRSDYYDVEDYGWAHIVFEDGTVADVIAGATVLGGINDYIDVFANNHRSRLNINPTNLMETYNPGTKGFDDVYVNYGISTKKGWLKISPDENHLFGYLSEMQDALESFRDNVQPKSSLQLAIDTTNVIYAAYLSAERKGEEVLIQSIGE